MEKWKQLAGLWRETKWVDLTRPLENGMPIPGDMSKYFHDLWTSYDYGDGFLSYQLVLNEHSGTHVDAPAHMLDRRSGAQIFIDENPVERYSFPCAVISCPKGAGEAVSREDITRWEVANGAIRSGWGVFFDTGWGVRWKIYDPQQAFIKDWPGLSAEAADFLVERGVAAVGTDCLSIDPCGVAGCPAHHRLLGANIPIFENLNHLGDLPARCFVTSLPLPIREGTASPVRVLAAVN